MDPKDFAQTIYSQCGEDLFMIQNFFREKQDGFYVDVGAHHPYRLSNTALLHQRGWRGINIDVDSRAIDAFDQIRPNDINILSGVAGHTGLMTLHLFGEGSVNTLSDSLAVEYSQMPGRVIIEEKTVRVHPLKKLLGEFLPEGQEIDLLSVDVEGLDEEVLRSNDWDKYRPAVLCVEIHGANVGNVYQQPTTKYLLEQGYQPAGVLSLSVIFQRLR